ncbi:MAG TPA: HNH endonuclease [Gemmataceae bacterium]|nr:HNH endonuclease [Gemmataceae bacterium]
MANREQLYRYKGNQCAHCGLGVQEILDRFGTFACVFEFNHIDPIKKHPDYDNVIRRVISTEQLDEVDKCVLLCRNCHGIAHAQDDMVELVVQVTAAKRTMEQRFKGQLILDLSRRAGKFFTDQQVLFLPYRVSVGARKPRVLFGQELLDRYLVSYIDNLPEANPVVVRTWDKQEQVRIELLGEDGYRITHDVRCPLFMAELPVERGEVPMFWVRRGAVLGREGQVFLNGTLTYEGRIGAKVLSG